MPPPPPPSPLSPGQFSFWPPDGASGASGSALAPEGWPKTVQWWPFAPCFGPWSGIRVISCVCPRFALTPGPSPAAAGEGSVVADRRGTIHDAPAFRKGRIGSGGGSRRFGPKTKLSGREPLLPVPCVGEGGLVPRSRAERFNRSAHEARARCVGLGGGRRRRCRGAESYRVRLNRSTTGSWFSSSLPHPGPGQGAAFSGAEGARPKRNPRGERLGREGDAFTWISCQVVAQGSGPVRTGSSRSPAASMVPPGALWGRFQEREGGGGLQEAGAVANFRVGSRRAPPSCRRRSLTLRP